MIFIRNLNLSYGEQKIFDNVSLTVRKGQRIGLVGRNGAGKSTLLKILAGLQQAESGIIETQKDVKIAYMPQESVLASSKPVVEEALTTFDDIYKAYARNQELEVELAKGNAHAELLEQYAHVQSILQEQSVDSIEAQTRKVLTGLGFSQERLLHTVDQLSVGWRMRLVLAKLLLRNADIYLFDEPTNHLDIVSKDWFVDFLLQSQSGFLLVSHDRFFLDTVCEQIFELEQGKGRLFQGNYTKYLTTKEEEKTLLEQRYAEQQRDIKQRLATIERFKAKASKAKMAQSMMKALDKEERFEKPHQIKQVRFSFAPVERTGRVVLEAKDVGVGYGNKVIIDHVDIQIERGEKVALVAANGVGKTTLFKAITGRIKPLHGLVEYGHQVKPAFFEQEQDTVLEPHKTILEEVEDACKTTEERIKVRALLGAFLFTGDTVNKKIRVLSGGEKNRVAMVKILLQGATLLLLDEPTNHLDLISKDILLEALKQYDGTILFVSHDRDFVQHLASRIVELTPSRALSFPGDYENYVYQKRILEGNVPVQKGDTSTKPLTANVESKQNKSDGKRSYEEQKKVRNLESKIASLERQIAFGREKLGSIQYGSPEYKEQEESVKKLEVSLQESIAKWEALE